MKILFIYTNISGHENISIGIAYLSSYLKSFGHEVDLMDYTYGGTINDCIKKIRNSKPDIIGFSLRSGEFSFSLRLAEEIKKRFNIPIIFGGVHPTVSPEDCINQKNVDMICIGEGENALLELLNRIEKSLEIDDVKNFWIKKDGKIIKNTLRPLEEDLDKFPVPDWSLFDFERYCDTTFGTIDIIASRGCPFHCTYCINTYLRNLYKGESFVRYHTVDYILDEISQLVEKYKIRYINFQDDTFILNKSWLSEFSKKYHEKIGIPFSCNARVDLITPEICELLKNAGCISISMGIESGSEKIRKEVLKRPMTDEQILSGFKLARDFGFKTSSYNILGIPFETEKEMRETIQLNREAKPDFLGSSIFLPYPGTELHMLCKENGWIRNFQIPSTHRVKCTLNYPYISAKEIERWKRWFRFNVFISYDIKKAFLVLIFDLTYSFFARLRARIPKFAKNFLFRVNKWLRYKD